MRFLDVKLPFAASLAFALSACASSPGDRAEEFYIAVSENETGEALAVVDPGLTQAFGAKLSSNIAKNYEKSEARGGLLSLNTTSEVEGDRANVRVTLTFGDGTKQEDNIKMRKIDGEWYLTM